MPTDQNHLIFWRRSAHENKSNMVCHTRANYMYYSTLKYLKLPDST